MEDNFSIIWNKLKSKDFKSFVLNKYDFIKLTDKHLIELINIYRHDFNLQIKV